MTRHDRNGKSGLGRRVVAGLSLVAVGLSVTACSGRIANRGHQVDPDRLAEITVGTHTRDDVAGILGSPSTVPVFDDQAWYYISNRTETLAFLEPKVLERQVVVISFGQQGYVTAIDMFGLERAREVEIVDRETPTTGSEMNIIQQFLGNLGRFNKETTEK